MIRYLSGTLLAFALALVLGACGDHRHPRYEDEAPADPCEGYSSCGSCTPVVGCGWCFGSDGQGECSSDPDTCAPASWNWNPSGCTVLARPTVLVDAGAVDADAGL